MAKKQDLCLFCFLYHNFDVCGNACIQFDLAVIGSKCLDGLRHLKFLLVDVKPELLLGGIYNLRRRLIQHSIIEALQFNLNLFRHILHFYERAGAREAVSTILLNKFDGTCSKCDGSIE